MWDPFGASSPNITSWKSGPNERGTINILSTCLITLILCVYTCLHLNIPGPGQKTWFQRFKRKSLWLLVGLFAPEFVAYVAFYDWILAKNMETRMKTALDPLLFDHAGHERPVDEIDSEAQSEAQRNEEDAPSRIVRRMQKWTRIHSHYAIMGGYAFDMRKLPINFAPNQATRLTLTPDAVLELAKHEPHLVPDISDEEIQDKSKADGFTKTFVCIQALWFLAQIIGRLAEHQPIGLLEMNTLLHALCCLIVYAGWWHKPLDIEEPTLIDAAEASPVCAYMIMQSDIGSKRQLHDPPLPYMEATSIRLKYDYSQKAATVIDQSHHGDQYDTDQAHIDRETGFEITPKADQKPNQTENNKPPPVSLKGFTPESEDPSSVRLYSDEKICNYYFHGVSSIGRYYMNLTPGDLERLRIAQHYRRSTVMSIVRMETQLRHQAPSFYHHESTTELNEWPDSLHQTLTRWAARGSRFRKDLLDVIYIAGILACSSVYGGVHLLAWHSHFPSATEKYLWRSACFVIVSPFPIAVLVFLGFQVVFALRRDGSRTYVLPEERKGWARRKVQIGKFLNRYLFFNSYTLLKYYVKKTGEWAFVAAVAVLYIAARIYLVAESFRSLGYMPVEVYKEPEWSKYFPHFGAG